MFCKKSFLSFVILFIGVFGLLMSCDETSIPVTPPEPFLYTSIEITNNTTPNLSNILTKGQIQNFTIHTAYTLNPTDAPNVQNISFIILMQATTDADSARTLDGVVTNISSVTSFSNDGFSITIPTDAATIDVLVALTQGADSTFEILAIESNSWEVR